MGGSSTSIVTHLFDAAAIDVAAAVRAAFSRSLWSSFSSRPSKCPWKPGHVRSGGGRRFCRRRSKSGLCVGRGRNRPRALFQSESAKDQLHRVDRGRPVADAAVLGPDQSGSASSSAATLPSSSSMTRISTLPSMARSAMRPDLRVRQRLYCPPLPGWEQELLEIVRCGQTEDDHRATRRILPGSRKGLKHFAVHLPRNKCR